MANTHISRIEDQERAMERYYELQSKIYDATRWAFLFGRRRIIRELPFPIGKEAKILEVGCGTGYNLRRLARWFPNAQITGIDVSAHMINKAGQATAEFGKRVQLIQEPYAFGNGRFAEWMDAVLFSYSLTMINPQWKELIVQAKRDLRPGGIIAVVDFHDSRFSWFRSHMSNHHVRMDGHLLPFLNKTFSPMSAEVLPAYGGIWS
ncbi:MAG: class I SAM-dependent methyltransferase, partial [Phaeodactylibacter sp.]|nr:class I SAM-dependent methyltransferase [Phaeodactylibacter sp.]